MTTPNWEQAFDCLRAPERRAVLLKLRERTTRPLVAADGVDVDAEPTLTLDELDADVDDLRMHHVHLPKLVDAGYVERVDDGDELAPGDSFAELEQFLDAVENYSPQRSGLLG